MCPGSAVPARAAAGPLPSLSSFCILVASPMGLWTGERMRHEGVVACPDVTTARRPLRKVALTGCSLLLSGIALATAPAPSAAQTYEQIEEQVRRGVEADHARAVGDCSEVMVSWLGMRFTEVEQRQGKAHEACAAAQLFALRNRVDFLEALPRVAAAMGGTRSQVCPDPAPLDRLYVLYSNCHHRPAPYVPRPPDAWELARQKEVEELGPQTLRHIQRCVPRAAVAFAFNVQADGRITSFNDAGEYGRIGPPPEDARELARIERALRSDARCNVFPEAMRNRYISVKTERGQLRIAQVRDETGPSRSEMLSAVPSAQGR